MKSFILKIELTGDCKTPSDVGYTLSELAEEITNLKKWPIDKLDIHADGTSNAANGYWQIKSEN